MAAIKVRATQAGTYGGHLRRPGDVFFLVDIKDQKTGKIKHKAEAALAEEGVVWGGWMERVVTSKTQETEEAKTAREEKEAQEQAERDAILAAGGDPDDPKYSPETAAKPKFGANFQAPEGSNAGDNGKGGSQSSKEVL